MSGLKLELSKQDILRLAAESELDPRTVQRALSQGLGALKSERDRVRLRAAAERLGIALEPKRKKG
jgi:hypothetical protein